MDVELQCKLSHTSKCSGTGSLCVAALSVSVCSCCPEFASFSASGRRELTFFVVRINVACNHFATLPDLQVKPCLFPATINRRNTAKDNTEGKE